MYIGIDIGGSHTRIAGSSSLDNITLVDKSIFLTKKNFEEGILEIFDSIKKLTSKPKAIGIGIAGVISEDGRELTYSVNLSTWANKSMIEIFENEFGCPVYMGNDAIAQSLGEVYYGSKLDTDFLYLVWGTGLGGALISNNSDRMKSTKLDRKYLDKWEEKFGGKSIEKRFGETAKYLHATEWNIVLSELKDAIYDLSDKLHINTFVIGGGIVDKQKEKISKVFNEISSFKILFSTLGEDIGLYGGFALIRKTSSQ